METKITNPHDKFVKEFWSSKEQAQDFFINYLPQSVTSLLNLNELELTKDSFIDHNLREFFSDLLYRIPLQQGDDTYIYILLERKSYPEPKIAFHLLRYSVKIWENDILKSEKDMLSPIIPLVLYHGRSGWDISEQFLDLIANSDGLELYLPDFRS